MSEPREAIERLFSALLPVDGERRVVYKCRDCGHLFGRRFIPYAAGRGATVDACMCQMTSHRTFDEVEQRTP